MSLDSFLRTVDAKSVPASGGGFVEGTCHHVTPEGAFFTIESWDANRHIFGPAPWTTEPPPGARVLVLFLGAGVDRPWILSWWPS